MEYQPPADGHLEGSRPGKVILLNETVDDVAFRVLFDQAVKDKLMDFLRGETGSDAGIQTLGYTVHCHYDCILRDPGAPAAEQ
jgi:hypothetical protein